MIFSGSGIGGSSSTSASGIAGPSAAASSASRSAVSRSRSEAPPPAERIPGVDHPAVAQHARAGAAVGVVADQSHGPRAYP